MFTTLNWLIIPLLAIVPALGWTMVYRYLDHREQEPQDALIFALLAGMASTVPVFAMQRFFASYPDYNLLSLMQDVVGNPMLISGLFLVFVAVVEELVKALALLVVVKKFEWAFTQVVDGIMYGAMVGLGFALTENIYYFFRAVETFQYSGSFVAVFGIRSFGTMLAHTLFTGLFGFYFAKAYFEPFVTDEKKSFWRHLPRHFKGAVKLHSTFFHLLPERKKGHHHRIERNALIVEGFLVATVLHFLYNAFIKLEVFGQQWTFLMVPLVFVTSWYLWSRFFVPVYVRIVEFVKVKKGYRVRVR